MIVRSLLTGTVLSAAIATPSFAGGMPGSYVGTGVAAGLDGQGAAAALVGRVALPLEAAGAAFSIRPQVGLDEDVEAAVGASVDLPVAPDMNLYVGGGVAFRDQDSEGLLTMSDETVGYAMAGLEYGLTPSVALFADAKVAFGSQTVVVPTAGMAFRF